MPAPRGHGDIPNKDRTAGLSKAKRKGDAVEFSEEGFAKWVTGAHQRRVARQKVGQRQAADLVKAEKSADKRQQNEKVREIVRRQFGDVTVDHDGRVVFSGKNGEDYNSDDEYEAKQRELQDKREKKFLIQEKEKAMKTLPKWAQKKLQAELEMAKDDSIIKEQNESFFGAQYSFNKENGFDSITQKAQKNKLLNNLERENRESKDKENQAHLLPTVMNFENDDSVVVVETSNLDQSGSASAIISRRVQRDTARNSQVSANQIGRRAAAAAASTQLHTMASDSDGSDSDITIKPVKEKVVLSRKKQDALKKEAFRAEKAVQKAKKTDMADEMTEMQQLQAKFNNKSKSKKQVAVKKAVQKPKMVRVVQDDSASDYEEDQLQYFTTSSEEEEVSEVEDVSDDDDDVDVEEKDVSAMLSKFNQEDSFAPPQPQRRQREYTMNESEDDDDDDDEEEWAVVDEVVLSDNSDNDNDDDDLITAKLDKQLKKRTEKEQRDLEKQQHQYELEQQEKIALAKEKKEKEVKLTKRQKLNDPTRGGISSEHNRDHSLAASISAQLLNSEFTLESATPIAMTNASAWFMLPKPQAWVEQEDRKKRLILERQRSDRISEGTWDFEAEKQRNRKLTPLEAMEFDPSYGWEEGEVNSNKDLSDIFGIPAASMGGRYRKKPLSDKNKKRSSDARKAKKAEKRREKDQQSAMAFEAGFADTNTTGRTVKWADSDDDDDDNKGRGKTYRGGAKFDQQPKNRKDRKKIESKQKAREQNLHKRGKMVTGKYYFGEKDSAVTF